MLCVLVLVAVACVWWLVVLWVCVCLVCCFCSGVLVFCGCVVGLFWCGACWVVGVWLLVAACGCRGLCCVLVGCFVWGLVEVSVVGFWTFGSVCGGLSSCGCGLLLWGFGVLLWGPCELVRVGFACVLLLGCLTFGGLAAALALFCCLGFVCLLCWGFCVVGRRAQGRVSAPVGLGLWAVVRRGFVWGLESVLVRGLLGFEWLGSSPGCAAVCVGGRACCDGLGSSPRVR